MRIPLNGLQWFIGWPFVLAIVVRGFLVRNSSQNTLNKLFLIASLLFLLSLTFMGFTSFITADPRILSIGTTLGGITEAIALLVVWIMVAHMYFPRTRALRLILTGIMAIVALACIYSAVTENLARPTTLTIVDGAWFLDYPFSTTYQILAGILYSSFIFVAAKFWRQSLAATTRAQTWRLRGFALGMFLIGAIFVVLPFLNSPRPLMESQMIVIALGMMVMGSFLLGSLILSARDQA